MRQFSVFRMLKLLRHSKQCKSVYNFNFFLHFIKLSLTIQIAQTLQSGYSAWWIPIFCNWITNLNNLSLSNYMMEQLTRIEKINGAIAEFHHVISATLSKTICLQIWQILQMHHIIGYFRRFSD